LHSPTLFILIFFTIQSYFPIKYYYQQISGSFFEPLTLYDERFCWRMFSPTRQLEYCDVSFLYENGTKFDISFEYRRQWLDLLHFCRWEVIEAVTQDICRSYGVIRRGIVLNSKSGRNQKIEIPSKNICSKWNGME